MRSTLSVASVSIFTLALAACGGNTDTTTFESNGVTVNQDEGTITMETPEGSFTQTTKEDGAKEVTMPVNFPTDIPTPEGMELTAASTYNTEAEGAVFILQWSTKTLPENFLKNYETVMKQKGFMTASMDQGTEGGTVTFMEQGDKPDAQKRGGAMTTTQANGGMNIQLIVKEPTVHK